jgi:hypothetical protein
MKKLLPIAFCGLAAVSFSSLTFAGSYGKDDAATGSSSSSDARTPSGAGPTDNPNVTRDAQGREHVNKGKHTGQVKNKRNKDSSGAGSTTERKNESAGTGAQGSSDPSGPAASSSADSATKSGTTAGARSPDSTLPSVGASTSGNASGSVDGTATTK